MYKVKLFWKWYANHTVG